MAEEPDVNDAYALRSPEDIRALYKTWAHSYDTGFHDGQGYQLPREVTAAFLAAGGRGPVLDVGAGTGLVGAGLQAAGIGPVDGIDLSQDMLGVAAIKGCYRDLIVGDVTRPLNLKGADYAGVISAGTFTLGHVGPEALMHLLEVAASGAVFAISVNAAHFETVGFAIALEDFGRKINGLNTRDVRIYDDRADEDHRNDVARLVTFRKS